MNRKLALVAVVVTAGFAISCSSSDSSSDAGGGDASSGSSSGSSSSGGSGGSSGSSSGSSGASSGGTDGGCSGATPVSLTVKNFLMWCSVSVAGGNASSAASSTTCVAAGPVNLTATANPSFELGPTPWHGTAGDHGTGDPGTVTGSGQSAQSAAMVSVSGSSACVWVCCEGVNGTAPCPTMNQCP